MGQILYLEQQFQTGVDAFSPIILIKEFHEFNSMDLPHSCSLVHGTDQLCQLSQILQYYCNDVDTKNV